MVLGQFIIAGVIDILVAGLINLIWSNSLLKYYDEVQVGGKRDEIYFITKWRAHLMTSRSNPLKDGIIAGVQGVMPIHAEYSIACSESSILKCISRDPIHFFYPKINLINTCYQSKELCHKTIDFFKVTYGHYIHQKNKFNSLIEWSVNTDWIV